MFFRWLKQYMPRGLYGRAALILILPVITLQLLVSVVFIQRHFDGVTDQMTTAVSIEVRFLQKLANQASDRSEAIVVVSQAAEDLEMSVHFPEAVPSIGNDQPWTDLTGGKVVSVFSESVPGLRELSLEDRRIVKLWLDTLNGPMELSFSRRRVSASNPHQLLVIMVVMGALMTTIAYFFLRNQLRPIKRMAAAAQAYGKGRVERFTPTGAVEVRAAGTAFLDMRNRIERQSQSRTMMLSGISHDLRTPLTRLRLGLSLMDEKDAEPLLRDVDDMQTMVDGFLDFARADAIDEVEETDPAQLLQGVVENAVREGHDVTQQAIQGMATTTPMRINAVRRALENLVGNATRYGHKVQAGLTLGDRALVFVIEDDGPGIPDDQRDDAIRPFVRLDPSRNQDRGTGVGLGLAIVSDVARNHGGMLRLGKSEALGGLKAELVIAR